MIAMFLHLALLSVFFPRSILDKCFGTMCWSADQSKNISCDQHENHCQLDASGNPQCEPGSTDIGIECNTTNKYYHCSCNQDRYGQAYCDCMNAVIFWLVIGIMGAMFLITQLWLTCNYCKTRRKSSERIPIRATVDEQGNYGGTEDDGQNRPIAGGVRLFPPEIERLLPAEPGDSNFYNVRAGAPPPTYSEVTGAAAEFYNPPVNPYYNQLT